MRSTDQSKYSIPQALFGLREEALKRKGSQRGSVRSRSGSWYISYYAWEADETGNLNYVQKTSRIGPSRGPERLTKTEAENQGYEKFVAPANGPARCPQGQATVATFVDLRFKPERVSVLKKNGRVHYNHILARHIIPTLGNVRLADVTPSLVQRLISAKIDAGYSTQTVRHIKAAVGATFAHAKALGFWHGDLPTVSVRLPEMVHKQRQALTRDQVSLLVDAMPERYRPLVLFCAYTGVRIGEALGLRWRAVNLTDDWKIVDAEALAPNSVLIHENWTRGERTTPKKRASWRKIPLTTTAWYALMLQWEESSRYTTKAAPVVTGGVRRSNPIGSGLESERQPRGSGCSDAREEDRNRMEHNNEEVPGGSPNAAGLSEEAPVFAARNGHPMDAHNIAQRFLRKAGRAIGCPWVSWHVLRHTHATLTDAFLTPAQKQAVLGHASLEMSLRYSHPQIEEVRIALEKADSATGRVQ